MLIDELNYSTRDIFALTKNWSYHKVSNICDRRLIVNFIYKFSFLSCIIRDINLTRLKYYSRYSWITGEIHKLLLMNFFNAIHCFFLSRIFNSLRQYISWWWFFHWLISIQSRRILTSTCFMDIFYRVRICEQPIRYLNNYFIFILLLKL